MESISIFSRILRVFISILIIVALSFIYTYLTALNPIVYFNVIIWYFFGALLVIPLTILSINNNYIYISSILISCLTVYVVYGMKCSIFMETSMSALLNNSSTWLPKVNFGDVTSTITSWSEYKLKLNFLMEYDTLNLSFKGRKGADFGAAFTNFVRIIECLGILILPIYVSLKNKKENT